MSGELETGTILVAHPDLDVDPSFGRSVYLLLAHSETGTIGVNLTQPMGDSNLYDGGPMQSPAPIMIHASADKVSSSRDIGASGYALTGLYVANGALEPAELLAKKTQGSIVVMGYAGWGEGQLAMEAGAGYWTPAKVSLAEVLSKPAEERWAFAAALAGLLPAAEAQAPAPKTGTSGPAL
jgi:putative transcriptional regulator